MCPSVLLMDEPNACVCRCVAACLQAQDSQAVDQAASLVAFDRANHMGISDKSAEAIRWGWVCLSVGLPACTPYEHHMHGHLR